MTASSLADLDPGEFRKFLETVTVEEFASSLREHLAAEEESELEDEEDEEARSRPDARQAATVTERSSAVPLNTPWRSIDG